MDDELSYYENPETGGTFGFGEPLPAFIADQIRAGMLRRCDPPADAASALPETELVPKADGTGEDDGGADAVTRIGTPPPDAELLPEADVLPELAEPPGFRERHTTRKPRR
jgi:hypothetical protein